MILYRRADPGKASKCAHDSRVGPSTLAWLRRWPTGDRRGPAMNRLGEATSPRRLVLHDRPKRERGLLALRVGSLGCLCYVFSSVARLFFLCEFFLVILLVGCGRNERMDALYAQRCLNCHGVMGRGDGPIAAFLPVLPPDFRDTVERKSKSQIRRVIAGGNGLMPAFEPALSPAEINDMLQMVRFLSREGRQISWWENFDALVVAHCSIPWEAVLGYDDSLAENKP